MTAMNGLDLVCQGILSEFQKYAKPVSVNGFRGIVPGGVCAVTLQPCWNVVNHAGFRATTSEESRVDNMFSNHFNSFWEPFKEVASS